MKAWRQLSNQKTYRREAIIGLKTLAEQFPDAARGFLSQAAALSSPSTRVGKALREQQASLPRVVPVSRVMGALLRRI